MKRVRVPTALLVLLLLASSASPDVVVLKAGKPQRGGVHRDDATGVGLNPYHSRHPGMVFDVKDFPRSAVKEVIREEPLFRQFLKRAGELAGSAPDAWLALAEWCDENKLKEERRHALLEALRRDPAHEGALRAFGRSKFPRVARGNPDLDPGVRAAIEEYLKIRDPEERAKAHGRLKREHSVKLPQEYLDRILRSLDREPGLEKDRALTLRSTEGAGVYTLFVPKEYDPRRPWPLVLGLHGGGVGGKEGDAVVGSGHSAMNFYVRQAAARGYIVVCPTALAAPWARKRNEEFLLSVLEEIQLLYHVDLNRVYLTGHSMGGFGAWHYGEQMAERMAAVSPMAGGGRGHSRLVATNTPIFIFHGADDGVVGPSSDRAAARSLARTDHDFIYTELTGVGHGFPASIQKDLFDFFDARRLAPMRGKRAGAPTPAARSSFLTKVSRDEARFLGNPTEYGAGRGGERGEVKRLLKELRLGGGKAAAAAERLGVLGDEKAVKPLSGLLRHPATASDVKVSAARALEAIRHEDGYPGLLAGLRAENPDVFSACARAMATCPSPKAAGALVSSLAHLDKTLAGKRLGGARIHISDWDRWLAAFTAAVEGIGRLKAEGGSKAIRRTAVRSVVCAEWEVLYSPRAGQDPRRARRTLALAAVEALTAYGDAAAREGIEEMMKARADDPDIVVACERALD